jgi:hypothetical protein
MAVAFQYKSLLMQDFLANGHFSYLLASPEQALIDTLHISTRKGKRFKFFPELDFSGIDPNLFSKLLSSITKNTRKRITKRLQEFDSFPLNIYSPLPKTQRDPQDSPSPKGA